MGLPPQQSLHYASSVKSSSSVLATSSSPASSTFTLPALAAAKSHFRDNPSNALDPVDVGADTVNLRPAILLTV